MARLCGQLLKILKLRAAVAFPEWVHIIHVAHDRSRRFREGVAAQATQVVRLLKPPVNIGHAGFNELAKLELATALGDLHRAQIARPVIDVLEQMTMDGAEVGEIEGAIGDSFGYSLGDKLTLNIVQPREVPDAESIS